VIPEKILPDRGAFKIKTGGAGHVRENDLSMDKNYFNGKVIKSLSSQEILVHFLKKTKR
jgi:hypothetical protein